jgi:lysophospholipase L1-like esterase
MKTLQLLLISVIIIIGCKKQGNSILKTDTVKMIAAPPDTGVYNYLALGDSYTIGTSVNADESYPIQLANAMNLAGFSTPVPTIIAMDGWTTDVLIHAIISSNIASNKYQVVTLLIGVNDQYEQLPKENYRTNFIQLLHTAINFAGGDSTRVFVLSIPDYGVTPFANGMDNIIGPQIDAFNAINKQESSNAGVNYLDLTGISREAANDATLIASDGLHPSYKMYKLWIDQLAPMVIARMEKH